MSEEDLAKWVISNAVVFFGLRLFDVFLLNNSLARKAPFMPVVLKSWAFVTIFGFVFVVLNLVWGWEG